MAAAEAASVENLEHQVIKAVWVLGREHSLTSRSTRTHSRIFTLMASSKGMEAQASPRQKWLVFTHSRTHTCFPSATFVGLAQVPAHPKEIPTIPSTILESSTPNHIDRSMTSLPAAIATT